MSLRFLPFLALPFLALFYTPARYVSHRDATAESINLALRRTADGLLRAAGDSTSRIPAIEQTGQDVWRIQLEKPFDYDQLPVLLKTSFELFDIQKPYEVAIRRCEDSIIELGYREFDYKLNFNTPCAGREMPEGCHYIEVRFLKTENNSIAIIKIIASLLLLGGMAAFWYWRRPKIQPIPETPAPATDWLKFGNSQLEMAGQTLVCDGVRHSLTFREAKLLRLFASNPGNLLERDYIIQQVWADEGVLVGRSVDVFVSRLRKKLADDPTIGIVSVHGVGYRLEIGKLGN